MGAKKSRGNGEGTVYQQPDGRWCSQFYVTDLNGRRTRKIIRAGTKSEVLKRTREARAAQDAGLVVATRRPPTVSTYGEHWLTGTLRNRVILGDIKPATWEFYRNMWVAHIEKDLGHLRLDALTAPTVERWLAGKIGAVSATGKPIQPRTVQAMLVTLKKALNDAVRDGIITSHQINRVPAPKVPRRESTHLQREHLALLREAIRDHEHEALWTVLLGCGLRLGEALGLRWSDLDLEKKRLTVRQAVGVLPGDMTMTDAPGRKRGISSTKTAASMASVSMPDLVVAALKRQRSMVAELTLAAPVWTTEDLVFPSAIGTPLDYAQVGRSWRALRKQVGLPAVRIHDLRHSTATFLLAAGVDMKLVQRTLRHTRLATTADLYTHVLDEVNDATGETLGNYLTDAGWGS